MIAYSEVAQGTREEWRSLAARIKDQIAKDRLSVIAAGVAFYGLLALFPTLVAIVLMFGITFDPHEVARQVDSLSRMLPNQAAGFVRDELTQLTKTGHGALGLGTAGSIIIALWSSSAGVRTLMQALNVAYDLKEQRGLFSRVGVSLLLAAMVIFGMLVAMAAIVLLPILSSVAESSGVIRNLIDWSRWPIVAVFFWIGLVVLYRYAPNRSTPRWSWMNRGAAVAVVIWLIASLLFSFYVSRFGTFNRTYGSMGAIIVLLLWFLLSAWAVLIGAEVDATLERTAHPTCQ